VKSATSDEARYEALLGVMDALGIGVYSDTGEQIVGGAERGAGDFYLYELEVRMMAAALGRGDTSTVEDLARTLTDLPVLDNNAEVDPELLRQVLVQGAQESQSTPSDLSSLPALIVRQLGLTAGHPYDLFTDVPMDDLSFDPLASFLILTDILLPTVHDIGPVQVGATQLVAQSQGILKATAADDSVCASDVGTGVKETWAGGKWALGFVKVIGNAVKLTAVAIDGIHGSVLAYSVHVSELDQLLSTHYGHESAGQALHFRVKVEMLDALPDNVIKCGWLLGIEFPKQGPIKDVMMVWSQGALASHGTIRCDDTCRKTGADGIATLVFQPKSEIDPGRGWVVEERGQVTGIAMYQSRHKNVLGSLNQIITPKSGTTVWTVSYHQIPGYTVTLTADYNVHLHDYPTPPKYPHDHDYRASGKVTYRIFVPDTAVKPPYDNIPLGWSMSGSGHGSESVVTVGNGGGGDFQCSATYDGQWLFTQMLEDDGAKSRGERLRYVRMRPEPPADANYSGSCQDHLWMNSYTNDIVYPWIDLQASGTTTKTFDLCPAQHSSDITCEGEVVWTIKVEWSGVES
jgi:hypothetical protein